MKEILMTPPTLHELAGIFMLALAAALLIVHPSDSSHATPAQADALASFMTEATPIDGIETYRVPEALRR
jgi:hypothetical protein